MLISIHNVKVEFQPTLPSRRSHVFRPGSGENTLRTGSQDLIESASVRIGLDRFYILVLVSGLPESVDRDVMSVVGSVPGQFDDAEEDR